MNKGKIIPLCVLIIPAAFITGGALDASAASLSWMANTAEFTSDWWPQVKEWGEGELVLENEMKRLMLHIYKIVNIAVYTPVFLFNNDFFKEMIRVFSGLSIGLVTVASMIEGLKRIAGWSSTSFKKILSRLPILIGVCGFAPLAFVKAIEGMNYVTNLIFKLGTSWLDTTVPYENMWELRLFGDVFETIGLFLFILLYISLLIPLLLNHSRRWFMMLSMGILTPFAMLGYVFESYNSLFLNWVNTLKGVFLVQLVYSLFLTILALIMFAVPFPMTPEGIFSKLLILLGGLYTLAVPPTFVKKFFDKGPSPQHSYAVVARKIGKFILTKS